jgi:site-specific DNA-adenine methylase
MRPFFSYYGSKYSFAAKHYPSPSHGTIVEPFAGAAGYALRHADRHVVLCDLDPVIVGVWRYLIEASESEILALPDLPEGGTVDDLLVPQEARWLIGFWLNRGTSSPCKTASRWMREGTRPNSFWGSAVRSTIAMQLAAIRHWQIYECPYSDCHVKGPATWFVDPPYQGAGRRYRYSSKQIDYAALAAWCRTRPGQVVVCENEGASWLPFRPLAETKATHKDRRSKEAVWLNSFDDERRGP